MKEALRHSIFCGSEKVFTKQIVTIATVSSVYKSLLFLKVVRGMLQTVVNYTQGNIYKTT